MPTVARLRFMDWPRFMFGRGEKERAMEVLERLVRFPGYVAYGYLLRDPIWDSLRGDPRFEKILASLAPKETASE
jgi:hypothetical protein